MTPDALPDRGGPTCYRLGIWPGDGIGKEVVREAVRVLERVATLAGFAYQPEALPFDADYHLAHGALFPADVDERLGELDAILFGAIGDPRLAPGVLERPFLQLCQRMGWFVNLRPTTVYAARFCPLKGVRAGSVDYVYVREATEDAVGHPATFLHRGTAQEVAIGPLVFSRARTEAVVRYAFELARRRQELRRSGRPGQPRVTLVHQANGIPVYELWVRVFQEVGAAYADVESDQMYPDAAAMWLLKTPQQFDVVVSATFIGGILTDIGGMLQGGTGTSGSARIHPGRVSLFEPTHGSAPKYAGKNVVCPIGAINALRMLLEEIGQPIAAAGVDGAVRAALTSGEIPAVDARSGLSTSQVGDVVLAHLEPALERAARLAERA